MRILNGPSSSGVSVIYGYSSAAAITAGFTRGDGETTDFSYGIFASLVASHQAVPFLQNHPAPKGELGYSVMRKVPTIAQEVAAYPPKSKNAEQPTTFFAPVGTPMKYQAALSAAIKYVDTRPAAKAALVAVGNSSGYVAPGPIKASILNILKQQPQLEAWLAATGAQ